MRSTDWVRRSDCLLPPRRDLASARVRAHGRPKFSRTLGTDCAQSSHVFREVDLDRSEAADISQLCMSQSKLRNARFSPCLATPIRPCLPGHSTRLEYPPARIAGTTFGPTHYTAIDGESIAVDRTVRGRRRQYQPHLESGPHPFDGDPRAARALVLFVNPGHDETSPADDHAHVRDGRPVSWLHPDGARARGACRRCANRWRNRRAARRPRADTAVGSGGI